MAKPVSMPSQDGSALIGALGGAQVKVLSGGIHRVMIPLPQLTACQVPVAYGVAMTPADAAVEYRVCRRGNNNSVLVMQIRGDKDQQIRIEWSSVVLVTDKPVVSRMVNPEPFQRETACVQSSDAGIRELAHKLYPTDGRLDLFACNIQGYVRGMKQKSQPRSMDAKGILKSGANWICTANANLAAALLRAKGVPARTLAVVPTTGERLEMHRTVECFDNGEWRHFDPSSLQAEIPLKPRQNIVMAVTSIADEECSMKPRFGASPGCPYGHELEFLDKGLTLWGQDFFWTMARPVKAFAPDSKPLRQLVEDWETFLETGDVPGKERH